MYDTIIIGSGPSGVSAAVYLKRSGFDVLVLSTNDSALKKAKIIENYYGFPEITGKELYDLGIKQLEHLNIPFDITEVLNIKSDYQTTPKFTIETTSDSFFAKSIILATGTSRSIPMISNIKDYIDKNISFCAICDGFFYRNQDVYVLGYGPYALSEAHELQHIAKSVTILTNGETPTFTLSNEIKVETRKIKKFLGDKKLEEIEFEDDTKIKVPGLFVAWKTPGAYEFSRKVGLEFSDNHLVVTDRMETSVKGIFACGDILEQPYQVNKAVYEGMIAATSISEYLKRKPD